MIRKVEHLKQVWTKTSEGRFMTKQHLEKHLVTTWYFLCIPIYRSSKVIGSNL